MAAQPGEENVATLFADIHYYYGPDTVKPQHHRFDKGSYVYLFENANDRRCRIEVANHAGTEDQDAFDGFLDQTHVQYSYKHHCMVSITVADTVDQNEWHLPTYDPRNENKYHYKLHSMDIYFWKQQDALQFVNGVRRVLPPTQVEVLDEPPPPPKSAPMSAVVQNLENMAISDPQYGTPKPSSQPSSQQAPSFAPPPTAPVATTEAATTFAPMAYNPAAPAAPETLQHREKTPPPPDEDPVNPLAVAVAYDYQKQPFTPGFPPHSQFPPGSAVNPALAQHGMASPGMPPPQFGGPPQHPGLQRSATMPVQSPYGAQFPGTPGFAPPPPPQSQPTPPVANPQVAPPPGGYSQYSYAQQSQPAQGGADYGVHQQVYQPTQAEMRRSSQPYQPKTDGRGKLEENAGRLERGVSGMLKKFEKKFG